MVGIEVEEDASFQDAANRSGHARPEAAVIFKVGSSSRLLSPSSDRGQPVASRGCVPSVAGQSSQATPILRPFEAADPWNRGIRRPDAGLMSVRL